MSGLAAERDWCGRLLFCMLVRDRDDREPRLDRLVIGELQPRRAVRSRRRSPTEPSYEVGVRRRSTRQRECRAERDESENAPPSACHASCRFPPPSPPPRASSPAPARTSASARAQADDRERAAYRRRRARSSPRSSAPEQPRPRARPVDDRAVRVRLLDLERVLAGLRRLREELEQRVLAGRHIASRPGHLLDDRAVAGPVCWICCVQPGAGTNESMPNPFGTVITIFVVFRSPSRSAPRGCRAAACRRMRRED